MLTNETCAYLSLILYIPLLVFLLVRKTKVIKIINISLCYISTAIVVSAIFFPLPFQKEVMELHNYHTIILAPFKQFIYLQTNPLYTQAVDMYIRMWISDMLLFLPMGFMLASHIKKSWQYVATSFLPTIIYFSQCLLMLIIKCIYRDFEIEKILFYTLGFIFGILLNKFILIILKRIKSHSDIINLAYNVLTYSSIDKQRG